MKKWFNHDKKEKNIFLFFFDNDKVIKKFFL